MKPMQESPDICSQQSSFDNPSICSGPICSRQAQIIRDKKETKLKKKNKTKTSKTNNFLFFVSDTSSSLQINDAGWIYTHLGGEGWILRDLVGLGWTYTDLGG